MQLILVPMKNAYATSY